MNDEFHVYYECCKCKKRHRGDARTPDTCKMVPGPKPNEWVFICVPPCESSK